MSFLKKLMVGKKSQADDGLGELEALVESQAIHVPDQLEPSLAAEISESSVAESVSPESVLPNTDQLTESILVSHNQPASEPEDFSFTQEPAKKKGLFSFFKKSKPAPVPTEPGMLGEDGAADGLLSESVESTLIGEISSTDDAGIDAAILADPLAGLNLDEYANFSLDFAEDLAPIAAAGAMAAAIAASPREQEIVNEIGNRPNPLPVIGKLPAKTQYGVSVGLLLASLALAGGIAGTGFLKASANQSRAEAGTRLQMLTQRLMATAEYTTVGSAESLARLLEARKEVDLQFKRLVEGTDTMSPMALNASPSLANAHKAFNQNIYPLLEQVTSMAGSVADMGANVATLNKATGTLNAEMQKLVVLLQSTGAPSIQVSAADHLRVLTERLHRNGGSLLSSNDVKGDAIAAFDKDFKALRATMATLSKGDAELAIAPVADAQAKKILESLEAPIADVSRVAEYLQKNAGEIVKARQVLLPLSQETEKALAAASSFSSEMSTIADSGYSQIYLSAIFLAMALASLALIGLVNNRITRAEAWDSAFRNKRNEKDIIDFMEACLPLEMGNLTVRFNENLESMEGITGGIRNSVNEAVLSLNDAVGTVKKTAEDVSSVVTASVLNTSDMKVSNERQTLEIEEVEERVAGLTAAIADVTQRTLTAAHATEQARSASEEGAKVVSQTNAKMALIRSNMQEVLKSVKHLGETSHEIGDIVNTIEQITDRTQVLAVNASLEAAKAGAAGAGFQIIAGEVNRLAEQSAEALRTITALVQRVQGETGSTIRVVEESTNNVVEGARLSEVANTQLEIISKLAGELSTIMDEIRVQSENQTSNATEVRVSMGRLAELSREFQAQVAQVVGGVEQIDASMSSLKNTVSIFTTEKA